MTNTKRHVIQGLTKLQIDALRWAAEGKTGLGNAASKRGLRKLGLLREDGTITDVGRAALKFVALAIRSK